MWQQAADDSCRRPYSERGPIAAGRRQHYKMFTIKDCGEAAPSEALPSLLQMFNESHKNVKTGDKAVILLRQKVAAPTLSFHKFA
jgi:hypothetical protein